MKSATQEKIKQRAEQLKMQACENHDTKYFMKQAERQIYAEEKIEKRIKKRAEKLRLQSPEYHDFEYYMRLAEYQIKLEQDAINRHRLYDPRKWINSLDYRCLKVWATQLKKCSFLNILEQIAVLSILVGITNFLIEAKPRYEESIREQRKSLAEVIQLGKSQEILINEYLYNLNHRHKSFAQLFNFPGFLPLVNNTFKGKKIYIEDRNTGKCKKIREIALVFPRWPQVNLINLKLPEGIKLSGAILCNAKLQQAVINKIELNRAQLAGGYLVQAKLRGTELLDSNLTNANLVGADLTDTKLIGANLTDADLTTANLTGASLGKIEVNNLTKSQLKLACNWGKANYIYRQIEDEKWELDAEANQQYIKQIEQDKASDPQTPVDCSEWDEESVAQ